MKKKLAAQYRRSHFITVDGVVRSQRRGGVQPSGMRHTEGRAPAATGGRSAPTRSRQARAGSVVARGLGDALGQGSLGN
jgi:hypothetical protein